MTVPAVLLVLALAALVAVRLRTLLTYFQQEEYNSARFKGAVFRVRLYDVMASAVLAVAGLLASLGGWILVLAALALAGLAWREHGYRYKKPLVMTERARRLYALSLALAALPTLLVALSPFWGIAVVQALPLALMGANALLAPLQESINRAFIKSARAKLARMNPVCIGITGSFGKTTVKHILAEMLETSGPVFYSRGSINTELGLTRHIRQRLQWAHRYFIAEMGAYGIGSIKRLCRFAQPTYGIVTAVGDAHTERFGSIENIAIAKCELPQAVVDKGGLAVIAYQVMAFAPFQRIRAAYPDQIVTVGREPEADVVIERAGLIDGVWEIALHDPKGPVERLTFQLPLLGEHNIVNSALAATLALRIDPGIAARLPLVSKDVEQIPHRLQKRETRGQALVLDDAFNSNEGGFRNAVDVLTDLARARGGRAILVTPGIAELGIEHDRVHQSLGAYCNTRCDEVHVVNPSRIPTFVAGLDPEALTVHEAATLAEARRHLAGGTRPEDVVLYENDLPDLLEETRLL
ncbi:MAG: UDP-N-acetylmuramoyl-tripeptide--D-alanyl-D-alanine ligase [Pseudomonadota bacterium]